MNRKQILTAALTKAIYSLKNDLVHYNWKKQQHCNCGIMVQAITGMDPDTIIQNISQIFVAIRERLKPEDEIPQTTWKNLIKYTCGVTGKSVHRLFADLMGYGLLPEDLVHLEFMSNPAILKMSGIDTSEKATRQTITYQEQVAHSNWFKRILGRKETINRQESTIEGYSYYERKENLILYLEAWLKILTENNRQYDTKGLSKEELNAQLILAEASEQYEDAAQIRDLLLVA